MPLQPQPVQPIVDPAAADLGTMVDLGLAPEQPEPPADDTPPTDPGDDTPAA